MPSYYVINVAGNFYSHNPGYLISWGELGRASVFKTEKAARNVTEKHRGSRVVKVVGKRIVELE